MMITVILNVIKRIILLSPSQENIPYRSGEIFLMIIKIKWKIFISLRKTKLTTFRELTRVLHLYMQWSHIQDLHITIQMRKEVNEMYHRWILTPLTCIIHITCMEFLGQLVKFLCHQIKTTKWYPLLHLHHPPLCLSHRILYTAALGI